MQDDAFTFAFMVLLDVLTAYALFRIASIWEVRANLFAKREDEIEKRYLALSVEKRRLCTREEVPHFSVVPTVSPTVCF
jgi:hypothetical protein